MYFVSFFFLPIRLCSLTQIVCIDNKPGISRARKSPARKSGLFSPIFGRRLPSVFLVTFNDPDTNPPWFLRILLSVGWLAYTLEASTNAVIPLNCSPWPTKNINKRIYKYQYSIVSCRLKHTVIDTYHQCLCFVHKTLLKYGDSCMLQVVSEWNRMDHLMVCQHWNNCCGFCIFQDSSSLELLLLG